VFYGLKIILKQKIMLREKKKEIAREKGTLFVHVMGFFNVNISLESVGLVVNFHFRNYVGLIFSHLFSRSSVAICQKC
jgi:hypothetical protein